MTRKQWQSVNKIFNKTKSYRMPNTKTYISSESIVSVINEEYVNFEELSSIDSMVL